MQRLQQSSLASQRFDHQRFEPTVVLAKSSSQAMQSQCRLLAQSVGNISQLRPHVVRLRPFWKVFNILILSDQPL